MNTFLPDWIPTNLQGVQGVPRQVADTTFQLWRLIKDLDSGASAAIAALGSQSSLTGAVVIQNTHVNKVLYPPANYALGSFYWETDRTVLYMNQTVKAANTWVYITGTMRGLLAELPSDLGNDDAGFLFEVTDYAHVLVWRSGWNFFGNDSSNYFVDGTASAPSPVGWHACDGTTVQFLKSDGTLGSTVLPDCIGTARFVKSGASYDGSLVPATGGTITGNTASAFTGASTGATTAEAAGGSPTTVAVAGGLIDPGHVHGAGTLVVSDTEPAHTLYCRWFRK